MTRHPLTAAFGVLLTVLLALGLVAPTGAYAAPNRIWNFDRDPLGAPPPEATLSQGEVRVVQRTGGAAGDRAVQLDDTSASAQSKVVFGAEPVAARRYQFDLLQTSTRQPAIVAIRGQGENPALGAWRFLLAPASNGDTLVSAYDGRAWRLIGLLPGLDKAYAQVSIEATTEAAVLIVGDRRLKTVHRASPVTALTGIEFASSGAGAVGTGVQFDRLALKDTKPRAAGLVPVLTWNQNFSRGQVLTDATLATVDGRPSRAEVNWGSGWEPATVVRDGDRWAVQASHTFTETGRIPLRVRVFDADGVATEVGNIFQVNLEQVLIARETLPSQIRFPDITRRADGSLIAAYYVSEGHIRVNGVIKTVTSTDNGATWSQPSLAVQTDYDARDPKITKLADGTLLLSFFGTRWLPNGSSTNVGTLVTRSSDGGRSWSTPVKVDTAMTAPDGWAASHGAAVQLANSDVLLPLYGQLPGDTQWRATVIRSTDGGRTFSRDSEVTIAYNGTQRYAEPNLTVLPGGEIVSLIRMEAPDVNAQLVRTFDGGRTWTAPVITDIPARSHHQLLTSSGKLLLTYGNPLLTGRPTEGRMIADPSGSWNGAKPVLIYDAGNGDQANPSSIELSPGRYLTLGYDIRAGTLVGVFTTDADYQ